jgi:hypothetical protein
MRESYPVTFFLHGRLFKWTVMSRYPDGVVRPVVGPFWAMLTAERIKQALVMHYRTGFDMGADQVTNELIISRKSSP